MLHFFCILTFFLLLSGLGICCEKTDQRLFPFSLLRILVAIPLLTGEYFFLAHAPSHHIVFMVFITESLFALIWFETGLFLKSASESQSRPGRSLLLSEIPLIFTAGAFYCFSDPAAIATVQEEILYSQSVLFFVSNLFMLLSMLVMAWQLEIFWRKLSATQRWEYKFFAVGSYLICTAFGWAGAHRFTYHRMNSGHFHLLALILVFAWLLIFYAAIRHRMFNRKFFVSRKVVYASVAPMIFGIWLIAIGLISLIMKIYNFPFSFVFQWFLIVAGIVFICLMAVSGKVRHNIRYFISTHFYINKYEYRDEWLYFSRLLQGAISEAEIADALHQVMVKTLYTNGIFIWLGDEEKGYDLILQKSIAEEKKDPYRFSPEHPFLSFLKEHSCYYSKTAKQQLSIFPENTEKEDSQRNSPVLFVPMIIGERMVGIVGLAPEFTGGSYGPDDFDLLSAICTQAASAILAARMAEASAKYRQQEAWDAMSSFVLHDVKNASAMLSLLRRNATENMDNPEFQQDLLETLDDALKRMEKVQNRMSVLKKEIVPVFREIEIRKMLEEECRKLERRLQGLAVQMECPDTVIIRTDPELLMRVMENILLNAFEAGEGDTLVNIRILKKQKYLIITVEDNGPGISPELLPDRIFEPFYTSKSKGSGIGLWQAKRLMTVLGGNIRVENGDSCGARFVISLPAGNS
ncbi:MAG: XrtA/PEP-CTERM system histidine kinase PrsK [Desulfococcaceae bacterium]